MKKAVAVIFLLFLCGISCQEALAKQDKEDPAEEAAQEWLSLVDDGKYAESWNAAATYFQGAVTKESWMRSMQGFRQPLGKVKSRELISRKFTRELPGAPYGEYLVIQYRSSFENKRSAIETVTPMHDKDGKWRVSGYYIK